MSGPLDVLRHGLAMRIAAFGRTPTNQAEAAALAAVEQLVEAVGVQADREPGSLDTAIRAALARLDSGVAE